MHPKELRSFLDKIIEHQIQQAIMIWGKPGIGKSSIVSQLTEDHSMSFVDVRLSQLMPSDLRGVPVPVDGVTHWHPPAFLPREGQGVLFLDEINMAPPALQGVAQQLILDRRVGDYQVPDGWYIWAAGNRKEDRAAVFEMPAPLANRFIHIDAEVSLQDFKQYAFSNQLDPAIIGFLSFRSDLLYKYHDGEPNWPSPRTWEMASKLNKAGLAIEPAVGPAAAIEFEAYNRLANEIPNIDAILTGNANIKFPEDPSVCYATVSALVSKISNAAAAENALNWLMEVSKAEWVQLFAADAFPQLRKNNIFTEFATNIVKNPSAKQFLAEFASIAA